MENKIGRTVWFDLPVANLSDAMSFYEGLLGWKYRQMEDSPLTDYVMVEAGGQLIGGLRKVASPPTPLPTGEGGRRPGEASYPILYFTVEKLDPKVARAKELGATLEGQTVNLGKDRGRYQWIRDRAGNLIGLWAPE